MTREGYYAIRIGDPGRHFPYFMVGMDSTPMLFQTRAEAEKQRPKEPATKVVKVWLTNGRAPR